MERVVQLFLEGERVELFKDEQITINSTIQNIQDLSKTFTDFTQAFTVPASAKNNELFQHFYNSDVAFYNGVYINPSLRRDAFLEIDNTFFRRGKLSLEKANMTNGKPYSYTITFYGDLVSLKDKFGEAKFIDLDWTSLNFAYTFAEIKARVEDGTTDYDVRYPLISGERYWQYDNSTTPTDNIDTSGGAINYQELFPAVKLSAILDIIQTHFGVTFQGGFLQSEQFKKAFMYFKSTVAYNYVTPPIPIVFNQVKSLGVIVAPPFPYTFTFPSALNGAGITFDNADNSILLDYVTYEYEFPPGSGPITNDAGNHIIQGLFTNVSSTAIIYVDVYRQGQFQSTIEVNNPIGGGVAENLWFEVNTNNPSINSKVSFQFRSSAPITCDIELRYYFQGILGILDGIKQIFCNSVTTLDEVDLTPNAPDLKVQDFISNLLKLFNLTAYGISENVYELQTIEEWYNEGEFIDVTEHVDLKSITLSRIKLFKNIAYEYKQSKSLTNREFANIFLREYGNLVEAFDYDGGDYATKVVFENLLFNKFDNIDLQVAYCIDEGLKGYVPGPCILYEYGEKNANFYMTDGTTPTQLTTYVPFGQDLEVINENYSLNWGTETSSLLLVPVENALYNVYYKAYLENLYNPKNRETTVKAILPLDIVTSLKLNDRLTLRDRRYIINNLKINLTTGETTMVLVSDFRRMIADGIPPIFPPLKPDRNAQCFDVFIPFVRDATQCVIATTAVGVTITPSTITTAQNIEVCIPANTGSYSYIITEASIRLTTEDHYEFITDESTGNELIILTLTWALINGTQVSNQIFIEQQ